MATPCWYCSWPACGLLTSAEWAQASHRYLSVDVLSLLSRPGVSLIAQLGGIKKFLSFPQAEVLLALPDRATFHIKYRGKITDTQLYFQSPIDGQKFTLTISNYLALLPALQADRLEIPQQWEGAQPVRVDQACLVSDERIEEGKMINDPGRFAKALALQPVLINDLPWQWTKNNVAVIHHALLDLQETDLANDHGPIDPACACTICQHFSRAYLHHLLMTKQLMGARLLAQHNLHACARLAVC